MKRKAVFVVLICLCLAACQPFEKTARDSVAAAKGFIEQAQANHKQECVANPNTALCSAINQAVAAQNSAIDALNVYCSSDTWQNGGACLPNKQGEAKLREAINRLNDIITHIKASVK